MTAWVLMTALPPTKGHYALMDFASRVGYGRAHVLVCTQPSEPMARERYYAILSSTSLLGIDVEWLHRELPQDPETPGFWPMWDAIMHEHGFKKGDAIVSSEPYGAILAERLGGVFMPYDPGRELVPSKATAIRDKMTKNFADILPEVQHNLVSTITIFGAESTGKTTLSKELAEFVNGHWVFEWARPYLETVGTDITVDSMTAIWRGQLAVQKMAHQDWFDKPFVIQDTDLYSTIGYWEQPHWKETLGPVPEELILDAKATQSDLYIITRANIPFEEDPLRYGGDHRESPDEYWIGVAERYGLNYIVLDDVRLTDRLSKSMWAARMLGEQKNALIAYDRKGF